MVNTDISDLFFNTDHAAAQQKDARGNHIGYDPEVLAQDATDLLASLARLGVADLPESDALMQDFFARQ